MSEAMDAIPSTEREKHEHFCVHHVWVYELCVHAGTMAASAHQGPTGLLFQDVIVEQVTQPLRTPGSVGGSGLPDLLQG